MSANNGNGISRQGSKKSGGSRSRLSSSNDEPTPDMFQESSNPEAGKKIVILSERRQIRNEITSNVKARKAEQAELQAIKEKTNKTENVERYNLKAILMFNIITLKKCSNDLLTPLNMMLFSSFRNTKPNSMSNIVAAKKLARNTTG